MNNPRLILIVLCGTLLSCASFENSYPQPDINLIVPGKTSEGYSIGLTMKDAEIAEGMISTGSLKDITKIESFQDLFFDSIIIKRNSAILFLKNKSIIAIAGLKIERRTTADAVLLSHGSDNFVQKYGTDERETIRIGQHKVHIYKKSGIAIFDDNSDDFIDMYLVFGN